MLLLTSKLVYIGVARPRARGRACRLQWPDAARFCKPSGQTRKPTREQEQLQASCVSYRVHQYCGSASHPTVQVRFYHDICARLQLPDVCGTYSTKPTGALRMLWVHNRIHLTNAVGLCHTFISHVADTSSVAALSVPTIELRTSFVLSRSLTYRGIGFC